LPVGEARIGIIRGPPRLLLTQLSNLASKKVASHEATMNEQASYYYYYYYYYSRRESTGQDNENTIPLCQKKGRNGSNNSVWAGRMGQHYV
jgi:hypothetical protein